MDIHGLIFDAEETRRDLGSAVQCSAKESEIYLRNIMPRTICLYSVASIFERSLSAVAQRIFLISLSIKVSGRSNRNEVTTFYQGS